MLSRPLTRGITSAVALAIGFLSLALLWLVLGSPLALLRQSPTVPPVVQFVPRQATGLVALTAPLAQLEPLRQLATPPPYRRQARHAWHRAFSAAGHNPLATILGTMAIDFDRDIAPWLGREVLLAVVPSAAVPGPKGRDLSPSDHLAILSTRNLDRSNLFLNTLWQRQQLRQGPLQVETYKGVQISSVRSEETHWAAAAVGDRYLALATSPLAIHSAIDSWQVPSLSLATEPRYQATLKQLRSPRVGVMYLNLPALSSSTELSPASPPLSQDSRQGSLHSLGVGLRATLRGLELETALSPSLSEVSAADLAVATARQSAIANALPANAIAVAAGEDLQTVWNLLQ